MAALHSVGLYLTTINTHKRQTSMKPEGADPHRRPRSHRDRLFWHSVDSKYISGLNFTAPLCDSSKCLFVDCGRKSEFGVWKTEKGWECITYQSTGWTKAERLKIEDGLCSPSVHSLTVAFIEGSYMFQLNLSHHQAAYIRSVKGNYVL